MSRRWSAFFGAIVALTLLPATGMAAQYNVRSCGSTSAGASSAWSATGGQAYTAFGDSCRSPSPDSDGQVDFARSLWFRPTLPPDFPGSPAGRVGGYIFSAAPGSQIKAISYRRRLQSIDSVWSVRLRDQSGADLGDDCIKGGLEDQCSDLHGGAFSTVVPAGTTALDLAVYCGQSQCGYGVGPLYDFAIAIYSSEVTIEENTPPTVDALTVTGGAGGYVGRSSRLNFGASDTLGIRKFEILRDGQVAATVDRTCVDWSVLPCSEPSAGLAAAASGSRAVGESGLYEGKQIVRVRATDGAGNTALSAPVDLTVDGFPWQAVNVRGNGTGNGQDRMLSWRLTGDGAPIASASAKVCSGTGPAPSDCTESALATTATSLPISLPRDGATATVVLTYTDVAGNVWHSDAIALDRDSTAPGAPTLALTGSNGNARAVSVSGEAGAQIRAELCPATGGTCSPLPTATAPATVGTSLANPGNYELRVTLTDGAGNTSAASTLRLSRNATQSELRPFVLKNSVKANLRKRTITLKGTVPVGSTTRIAAKLTGRTSKGKSVSRKATIKVAKTGKYSARISLPKGATTRRALKLSLTPTPATGWRATTYRKTIKP